MKTWLLKKIREDYIVQYMISGNIKLTNKDYTDFHYIWGFNKEWTYEFIFDNFIDKWYYPKSIKNNFLYKLEIRDTIRHNKQSVRISDIAKKHWTNTWKTQHSEQEDTTTKAS